MTYNSNLVKVDPHANKSRSHVTRFKQESTDKRTNKQTNGRYQMYYLPCFAVDNNVSLTMVYMYTQRLQYFEIKCLTIAECISCLWDNLVKFIEIIYIDNVIRVRFTSDTMQHEIIPSSVQTWTNSH